MPIGATQRTSPHYEGLIYQPPTSPISPEPLTPSLNAPEVASPQLSPPPQFARNASSSTRSSLLKPLMLPTISRRDAEYDEPDIATLQATDVRMKKRIRTLRIITRALAVGLSAAVLIPLIITLVKYVQTKDLVKQVTQPDGTQTQASAWPSNQSGSAAAPSSPTADASASSGSAVIFPTYFCFSMASLSLLLNSIVVLCYTHSVNLANRTSGIVHIFIAIELPIHAAVWLVGASLYKVGQQNNGGRDLWGWTCGPQAKALQPVFADEIDYETYCKIQVSDVQEVFSGSNTDDGRYRLPAGMLRLRRSAP